MALEQLSLARLPVDRETDGVNNGVEHHRTTASIDGGDDGCRAPRLPRWTRQEILILIQGKRVAENRVRRGRAAGMGIGSGQIEPKWASVSSYCKRHGVTRGPVQCRKRWSNLAGDFKKIKEWESQLKDGTESFWVMRNDLRRVKKLPGFFDREVYDILDGAATLAVPPGFGLALASSEETKDDEVFDSGRSAAAEDGLFSDFEPEDTVGSLVKDETPAAAKPISATTSVPEREYQPNLRGSHGKGTTTEKQPALNPEVGSTSQDGRKRKRFTVEGDKEMSNLQNQLIDVLEKNGKMLTAQLEAQNNNIQSEREQRKDHADSLVTVLNKLADALGRIADKL